MAEDFIAQADPKAIAIAPALTYGQLNKMISALNFGSKKFIPLLATPDIQTICTLFAAWRASLPVLLLAPTRPNSLSHLISNADLLLFTSGSSGIPKLASFKKNQLFESAKTVAEALKAKPQDRWLLSLPLHHVGGLGVVLRAFYSQGTLVFIDKNLPYPDRYLSPKAHFASCVPTQLYRLLKENFSLSTTHFLVGGAPLSRTLYEKALQKKLSLSLTYGLTEMSSAVLLSSNPIWEDHLPFLGFPLKEREILLSDGELLLRGAPLFEGYGCPPQKPPGWFPSGDLGSFKEGVGYKIMGRKDSLFFSGGENISPEEIEVALLAISQVEEAVVVPLYDEEFGARPVAFLKTNLSAKKIVETLAATLPKYKVPIAFFPLENSDFLKPNRKNLTEMINTKRDKANDGKKKTPFL